MADFSAVYVLSDGAGTQLESGKAAVRINDSGFCVRPEAGEPLLFSFRDISAVEPQDYKFRISLRTGEQFLISELGYKFEDFSAVLSRACNEQTLKDLLVTEQSEKMEPEAEYSFSRAGTAAPEKGSCTLRLYATSLAVLPQMAGVKVFPYREIAEIKEGNYEFTVLRENGDAVVFSKLGGHFDGFREALSKLMSEMLSRTQSFLKEAEPSINPLTLRSAAKIIKEGRAVSRKEIDPISATLWSAVEKKLISDKEFGLKYGFLKELARQEKICFGVKRGLAGALSGDYAFALVPVYGIGTANGGNAAALETVSLSTEQEGDKKPGRATYFFRITGRREFAGIKTDAEMDAAVDSFVKTFNACMSAINFRREPVFLSEAKLQEPRYEKYRAAVSIVLELGVLRKLFIGRVIHSDGWQERVSELLRFNVSSQNDVAQWAGDDQSGSDMDEQSGPVKPDGTGG